jgi:hypothetical protein
MVRGHALEVGRRSRATDRENPIAAWLRRPRRRREADALLRASAGRWQSHLAVAWRVAELTSPYERRRLARAVEAVVDDLSDRRRVLPCVRELAAIADLLADLERPITGVGVILVRDLLTDGERALHLGADKPAAIPALSRILDSLEAR